MSRALQVEALSVALGGRSVVREVSLEVEAGTWFGLLGVNGSGKTTLLRCLAARLPLKSGRIVVDGRDLTADEQARALTIGYAPSPDTLPTELRAGELADLLVQVRGAPGAAPEQISRALGFAGLRDFFIGAMSSGMRQRVALLTAFVGEPRLVLLDEPFNWLDPVAAYELKEALRAYVDGGATLVSAVHDVATFATRCDAGLLLHEGKVLRTFDTAALAEGRSDITRLEHKIYQAFPRV